MKGKRYRSNFAKTVWIVIAHLAAVAAAVCMVAFVALYEKGIFNLKDAVVRTATLLGISKKESVWMTEIKIILNQRNLTMNCVKKERILSVVYLYRRI